MKNTFVLRLIVSLPFFPFPLLSQARCPVFCASCTLSCLPMVLVPGSGSAHAGSGSACVSTALESLSWVCGAQKNSRGLTVAVLLPGTVHTWGRMATICDTLGKQQSCRFPELLLLWVMTKLLLSAHLQGWHNGLASFIGKAQSPMYMKCLKYQRAENCLLQGVGMCFRSIMDPSTCHLQALLPDLVLKCRL